MKFVAIIPARYASTRFPGKPLALLDGKPVIQRVYEQVDGVVDKTVVATDDARIAKVVENFGGSVVMTSTTHKSGTDRCNEALDYINNDFDVVINVQGDEPFIRKEQINSLKRCFDDKSTDIATLVKPFSKDDPIDLLNNPNSPKVVLGNKKEALYFSRSVIPYIRNAKNTSDWLSSHVFYKHIGIYAYKVDVLRAITKLPQSSLEIAESLEQLRWLQNGFKIKAEITDIETIGIDTPEDLHRAELFLKNNQSFQN